MALRDRRPEGEPVDTLDDAFPSPDFGDGVELAQGAEPVDGAENPAPIRSLTRRLMDIRAEASGVGKENVKMEYIDKKSGEKKSYTIQAHTIEGVLHAVRALFDRHGVWMQPQLVERTYTGNRCDVIFDFYFENVDDPDDRKVVRYAGADTDNGGKGFAKAGTNALKEMLKKVFLITDREDAREEEDAIEYRPDEGATRAEVDEAREEKRKALEQWAKTFRSALINAQTAADVKQLQRENRDQLSDAALPQITRDFFIELIGTRQKELEEKPQ